MKKTIRFLSLALVFIMGLTLIPSLALMASAESEIPVLTLKATSAINPILDFSADKETFGTGGPFTVSLEWSSNVKPMATDQDCHCFVGVTGYDEKGKDQSYSAERLNGKQDWTKISFTFGNVGFTYGAGNAINPGNIVRFGMWYAKGEMSIRNFVIKNAAGKVVYDMNTDPDIQKLMKQMRSDKVTETDLSNLASINSTCYFVAAQFGSGNYEASLSIASKTEIPTTPPTGPIFETTPPTEAPTAPPTEAPTAPPTEAPTAPPTEAPTAPPTEAPTAPPTDAPTAPPTEAPDPTEKPADPSEPTKPADPADKPNGPNVIALVAFIVIACAGGAVVVLYCTGKLKFKGKSE